MMTKLKAAAMARRGTRLASREARSFLPATIQTGTITA
jgi:hypothetical protein